ncbi:MAG: phosphodiester glycosidase family protein [Candidatus Zixiibacteriota bacterium]
MRVNFYHYLFLFCILSFACGTTPIASETIWEKIDEGLEVANFSMIEGETDSSITIIRINPQNWNFKVLSISEIGQTKGSTAREWCEKYNLTAAINGGMFDIDYKTHIGYLKSFEHVNSSRRNKYLSVAAFEPFDNDLPKFKIFDLDEISLDSIMSDYACVIQNLRLIKNKRENRWEPQTRKWAEAALAEDSHGNALFIFCSEQVPMYDFNKRLLALPIDLVAAQHLEGGIQAQMFLKMDEYEINLSGGFSTGLTINNNEGLVSQLPNVIGISRRDKND